MQRKNEYDVLVIECNDLKNKVSNLKQRKIEKLRKLINYTKALKYWEQTWQEYRKDNAITWVTTCKR